MSIFNSQHAKVLYLRFCAIYDHKFVKPHHDNDFKSLWENEWCSGLSGVNPALVMEAIDYCKKNLEWPPSIAEFIKICENLSGMPSIDDCMSLAVKREFNHPIVLMTYEKVGSWSMKNDTAKVLRSKFESAYIDAINKFRAEQQLAWERLESFNTRPKELPVPDKIPTNEERKSFKERLAEYTRIAEEAKIKGDFPPIPEFNKRECNPGGSQYDDYCKYLLSVPQHMVLNLPPVYAYDRQRLLKREETARHLQECGYIPLNKRDDKSEPNPNQQQSRPKSYKSWVND